MRHLILTALIGIALALPAQAQGESSAATASARAIHERAIVLDSHLDTPMLFAQPDWSILDRHGFAEDLSQVDYPRMVEGGLDGGFWVIFTPQGARTPKADVLARDAGLLRLMQIREMVARNAAQFELALRADDAERIKKAGKRIVYLSIENASPLASDPSLLQTYYTLGVRMLGLVHTANNDFADSSTDPNGAEWNGLSAKGRALVAEANRLGIVIDQSHASDTVFDQLLELSTTPIVLSHTGADDVYEHPRNIDDARVRKLAAKGGVIQVNSLSAYLIKTPDNTERKAALTALYKRMDEITSATQRKAVARERAAIDAKYPVPKATFEDFMKHLLHLIEVAGPEHVGLGADWDGGGGVSGLEDVAALHKITEALLSAGYNEAQIRAIWGGNLLRVMRAAEAAAQR